MLRIENTLISLDLIDKNFFCYLDKCKGQCCVKGDSGAPLTNDEVNLLPFIIKKVKPYMSAEGVESVEKQGTHVIDADQEAVTPLIDGKECAYTIFENGVAICAIEKAWIEKEIDFQKPVSCHLYPVRVKTYEDFEAVNYDKWDICGPARILGDRKGIPVFEFVKPALIRRFGNKWFEQLQAAAEEINKSKKNEK